jgi:predicted  nucleic acid-binding Zn-ribbon protein
MKKLILTIALGVTLCSATAFAYDRYDNERVAYHSPDSRASLDRQVDHLNRMLDHIRWQVRNYRADWRVRRDVQSIAREVDRLNHRFQSGQYDRSRMRAEIDRLHDRLHGVEQRLQVRSRDYYRWG